MQAPRAHPAWNSREQARPPSRDPQRLRAAFRDRRSSSVLDRPCASGTLHKASGDGPAASRLGPRKARCARSPRPRLRRAPPVRTPLSTALLTGREQARAAVALGVLRAAWRAAARRMLDRWTTRTSAAEEGRVWSDAHVVDLERRDELLVRGLVREGEHAQHELHGVRGDVRRLSARDGRRRRSPRGRCASRRRTHGAGRHRSAAGQPRSP